MRLTEYLKQALINRIVDDIPKEDYYTKLADRALRISTDLMPQPLRDLLKREPAAVDYLRLAEAHIKDSYFYVRCRKGDDGVVTAALSGDPEMTRLLTAQAEQAERLRYARKRIQEAVLSCSTDKQFADRFPEFAQYLPKVDPATANLPVDANLITDLMKLGWPKGKAPEVTKPKAKGKAKRAAAVAEVA